MRDHRKLRTFELADEKVSKSALSGRPAPINAQIAQTSKTNTLQPSV